MRRNHHPGYYALADQIDAEELRARGFTTARPNTFSDEFSVFKRLIHSQLLPFVISLLACISVVILWYLYLSHFPSPQPQNVQPIVTEVPAKGLKSEPRDIEHDVTVMKDVLRSLVTTVDRLSQQNQPAQDIQSVQKSEFQSAPFKITTAKANLREYPSKDSVSILTVPKDTILMGFGFSNGWIKTFTPNGKEAWIHASVTEKVESEG